MYWEKILCIQGSETWTHDTHCPLVLLLLLSLCQRWAELAWQGVSQGSGCMGLGERMMVCQCSAAQTITTSQKCGPIRDLGRDDHDQWEDGEWTSLGISSPGTHVPPACDNMSRTHPLLIEITVQCQCSAVSCIFQSKYLTQLVDDSLVCRIYFINKNNL